MIDFQVTTHVSAPSARTGRPQSLIWIEFDKRLELLKPLAKEDWASIKIPAGVSFPYAARRARKAGFITAKGQEELKVKYDR